MPLINPPFIYHESARYSVQLQQRYYNSGAADYIPLEIFVRRLQAAKTVTVHTESGPVLLRPLTSVYRKFHVRVFTAPNHNGRRVVTVDPNMKSWYEQLVYDLARAAKRLVGIGADVSGAKAEQQPPLRVRMTLNGAPFEPTMLKALHEAAPFSLRVEFHNDASAPGIVVPASSPAQIERDALDAKLREYERQQQEARERMRSVPEQFRSVPSVSSSVNSNAAVPMMRVADMVCADFAQRAARTVQEVNSTLDAESRQRGEVRLLTEPRTMFTHAYESVLNQENYVCETHKQPEQFWRAHGVRDLTNFAQSVARSIQRGTNSLPEHVESTQSKDIAELYRQSAIESAIFTRWRDGVRRWLQLPGNAARPQDGRVYSMSEDYRVVLPSASDLAGGVQKARAPISTAFVTTRQSPRVGAKPLVVTTLAGDAPSLLARAPASADSGSGVAPQQPIQRGIGSDRYPRLQHVRRADKRRGASKRFHRDRDIMAGGSAAARVNVAGRDGDVALEQNIDAALSSAAAAATDSLGFARSSAPVAAAIEVVNSNGGSEPFALPKMIAVTPVSEALAAAAAAADSDAPVKVARLPGAPEVVLDVGDDVAVDPDTDVVDEDDPGEDDADADTGGADTDVADVAAALSALPLVSLADNPVAKTIVEALKLNDSSVASPIGLVVAPQMNARFANEFVQSLKDQTPAQVERLANHYAFERHLNAAQIKALVDGSSSGGGAQATDANLISKRMATWNVKKAANSLDGPMCHGRKLAKPIRASLGRLDTNPSVLVLSMAAMHNQVV
jgi:hypothetical protein